MLAASVFSWVGPTTLLGAVFYLLVVVSLIPLSYTAVNFFTYLFTSGEGLPEVSSVDDSSTAVLYVTFNDVMPRAVEQNTRNMSYPVDKWILSDSTDPDCREKENQFVDWQVFRRSGRRGGKTGILNDWLDEYGDRYDYLVVLDSDSVMGMGSVDRLVRKAEHDENSGIAVFQSRIGIHSMFQETGFAEVLGRGVEWSTKINPSVMKRVYGANNYWGHNALIRVSALQEVGGFDEEHLSEDFALSVDLSRNGWRTVLTEVPSFEGFPADLDALRERTTRWVQGTRETVPLLFSSEASLGARAAVAAPIMFYGVTPVLLLMLLLAPFQPASPSAVATVSWMVPYAFLDGVYSFAVLGFVFLHEKAVAEAGWKEYLETVGLRTLVVTGQAARVSLALLSGSVEWTPSRKTVESISWREAFRSSALEVGAGLVLTGLMVLAGVSIWTWVVSLPWILGMLSTPVLMQWDQIPELKPLLEG